MKPPVLGRGLSAGLAALASDIRQTLFAEVTLRPRSASQGVSQAAACQISREYLHSIPNLGRSGFS
jgi:hypothetical protein